MPEPFSINIIGLLEKIWGSRRNLKVTAVRDNDAPHNQPPVWVFKVTVKARREETDLEEACIHFVRLPINYPLAKAHVHRADGEDKHPFDTSLRRGEVKLTLEVEEALAFVSRQREVLAEEGKISRERASATEEGVRIGIKDGRNHKWYYSGETLPVPIPS